MLDREGGVRDMAMACFMMSLRSPLGVERAAPDPFLSPDTGVGSTGRARAANTWNTLQPPEQCSFRAAMDSGLRASSDWADWGGCGHSMRWVWLQNNVPLKLAMRCETVVRSLRKIAGMRRWRWNTTDTRLFLLEHTPTPTHEIGGTFWQEKSIIGNYTYYLSSYDLARIVMSYSMQVLLYIQ